jgi:signal transduction histidine kinase/CheY-like chemotaxis protein
MSGPAMPPAGSESPAKAMTVDNSSTREVAGQEAIEIVRALRTAQADAFVFETAAGPMVRVLEGTAEPYRVMVDAAGEGTVVLDAGGVVLFANRAMGRLVGRQAGALVGFKLGAHMSETTERIFSQSLPDLMKGGTLDIKLRRGDESVPVHLSARPIHFAGFDGVIVVATDFSALQELTDELEQRVLDRTAELRRVNQWLQDASARIVEANRHKTIFLTNMSHELRTPLNAIIGFSELLLTAREKPYDAATQTQFLEQILVGGRHLLGLINDILDLSKVESGQMELRLQTVAMGPLLDQVIRTMEALAMKKHLLVHTSVADALEVTADPGKLKQMVLNLLSNAVKFTADGGTVTVKAVRVADTVEISVADNGIGITESEQVQIFKEFHQVDQGTRMPQQGTGLGLTLTERLAALHGGTVRVRSEIGKGSVFTITLPISPALGPVSPHDAEHAPEHEDPSKPLILVVEDNPPAAELIKRQLGGAGFRTHVARSGAEALGLVRTLKPAAITLDILLPDMDGWDVMTQLKRDESTIGIPIIVVSVVDNPELGLALGAIDYLVKPVVGGELIKRLHQLDLELHGGSGHLVLVVDDEATHRNWIVSALEPAGYRVIQAAGGRDAIKMTRKHHPSVVLLDLMMPVVSGFDVIEALNADQSTRKIPIVVITAAELTDTERLFLKQRVSTILRRGSVGAADLLSLLRTTIGRPADVA